MNKLSTSDVLDKYMIVNYMSFARVLGDINDYKDSYDHSKLRTMLRSSEKFYVLGSSNSLNKVNIFYLDEEHIESNFPDEINFRPFVKKNRLSYEKILPKLIYKNVVDNHIRDFLSQYKNGLSSVYYEPGKADYVIYRYIGEPMWLKTLVVELTESTKTDILTKLKDRLFSKLTEIELLTYEEAYVLIKHM